MATVTVLGAGSLGAAMATRLVGQGHDVRVWDRDEANAAAVDGAHADADKRSAVGGADVVLTVLPNADIVAEVIEDVLDDVTGVWLQVSTVGPQGAKRLGELAREHRVGYLDAPVSGSTEPAEKGELVWLVAGEQDQIERARPVLDALGKQVQHVGGNGTEGSALKLAVNAWMTSSVVVMSDVLRLCDALGLDHDLLRDALGAGPLAMPYALQKSEVMDAGDFAPGFAARNALKDLHLAADELAPSPVLAQVTRRLQAAVDAGHGNEDLAVVGRVD